MNESLLNERQAAAFLNVNPGTLGVWRSTKRYPLKYIKVGRAVRYREQDLRDFVSRREKAA